MVIALLPKVGREGDLLPASALASARSVLGGFKNVEKPTACDNVN
jgi:hypothetical protein